MSRTTSLTPANDVSVEYGQATVEAMEHHIRSLAASVVNAVVNRDAHPTYGYTKTGIRNQVQVLNGAIGLYGTITGQTGNATVYARMQFAYQETADVVAKARALADTL